MRIEKNGHYLTRGGTDAEIYEIRGAYCMGFIWLQDGTRKTGIWHAEQGTIMGRTPDSDLVEYVKPFDQPLIQ